MKTITPILASAAFVIFSASSVMAAQNSDSKQIKIKVNQPTYAVLSGSAVSNSENTLEIDQITSKAKVSFGDLGIKSNGTNCVLTIETDNDFTLKHEDSAVVLQKFALSYLDTDFTVAKELALDSCVVKGSPFSFQATTDAPDIIAPGVYRDTVTITLTAE
jgi:hypothetical protein